MLVTDNTNCTENPIPRNEVARPRSQFYIDVFMSDLYIPTIGPSIFCCIAFADRLWEYKNRSQIHECINWERGRAVSFLGIFVSNFRDSAFGVCMPNQQPVVKFSGIMLRSREYQIVKMAHADLPPPRPPAVLDKFS